METSQTRLSVKWHGSFDGSGIIRAPGFTSQVTLPTDFGGLNEGATPEDLLLAATASCYMITFGIVLDKAGIRYSNLNVNASMDTRTKPTPAIESVELSASITTDADPATLQTLSERAEKFCVIGRALNPSLKKTVNLSVLRESLQTAANT
jgi:putative redox protein